MQIDKALIIEQLIVALTNQLDIAAESAKAAYQGATDSESKAENKYDTRGLEASYLAHGQSRRIQELGQAINQYKQLQQQLEAQKNSNSSLLCPLQIATNCLVSLSNEDDTIKHNFYIGHYGGGIRLLCDAVEIKVITPSAPIAQQLMGKEIDDEISLSLDGKSGYWLVEAIS